MRRMVLILSLAVIIAVLLIAVPVWAESTTLDTGVTGVGCDTTGVNAGARCGCGQGEKADPVTRLSPDIVEANIDAVRATIRAQNLSWHAGYTSLADLPIEVRHGMRGVRHKNNPAPVKARPPDIAIIEGMESLPISFDWRSNGGDWTTPVKDQRNCGSCWAFAVTGVFESYWERYNNNPGLNPNFAEQYLVSCDWDEWGCDGGTNDALGYFMDEVGHSGGVGTVTESCFPYEARDMICKDLTGCTRYTLPPGGDWFYIRSNPNLIPTVDEIKATVYQYGPVSVYIYASDDFDYYEGGIFEEPGATGQTNHAVVIVGWGNDPSKGKDYWIVKNSYGTSWGENGWFRIYTDQCRVGEGAAYLTMGTTPQGPGITSISPTSASAGGQGFTLTVNGRNFASGSTVFWDGTELVTTFGSSSRLTAQVTASLISDPGTATVTVENPDGSSSSGVSFTISDTPGPVITSLDPTSVQAGGASFTLTIRGTYFIPDSVVTWNGVEKATTYTSSRLLTARIERADIASEGTASVTVSNEAGGGGTSNTKSVTISSRRNPVPRISGLSPRYVLAGRGEFSVLVRGSNFIQGSKVRWNRSDRTTTYHSSTMLRARIRSTDIIRPGSYAITVFNPLPGGGTSNQYPFAVVSVGSSIAK
ncbi:MAG: IPT/TIG domain-containing protein [Methanomicrobiales archaeon]|nr:IPT/TIG domain-containing protein [Methanomicrobiales archaeon]